MEAEFERRCEGGGQDPRSIVTISTPPPSSRLSERKLKDKCFRCGNQGHWAQDCRSTTTPTKNASSHPSTPPPDAHHFPVLRCHCGVACTLCVSRRDVSLGRRYYARKCDCGAAKGSWSGPNFYKWCEDVKAPLCRCGAGACTINFLEDSYGNYVKYYTCRIRTGHGSCGFLLFESFPSSLPRSVEIDKGQSISSPQNGEPPHISSCEDECSVPSSSTRNISIHEVETSDFAVGKGHRISCPMSWSDIPSRQKEFQNQMSAAGNSSNGCKALRIMGRCVHGWAGRLAFPPRVLAADPPLQHFFRCILPLFDPIVVSDYANISVGGSSSIIPRAYSNAEVDEESQNALGHDTQLLTVSLGTSSRKRSFSFMQDGVDNPVWKKVGKHLPKDLSLLVSTDPSDHSTIFLTANDTFVDLASPSIEFKHSAGCSTKSNRCVSRVAGTELALQKSCNQQEPTILQNIEPVAQLASHFKETLHQIGELETFLLNIAKDLGQSMRSMQATYQELTKALKLPEAEVEQCMAGTTVDQTCSAGRKRQRMVELPNGSE
ncbi:uncharacterized protein LOC120209913 isoform X2 [Hibiscus syriacus]|uniref:uncharacterized protein LOC120209913 isoform X2 n=1 Tax=Hibiscus syriacus TaxID=106335 RepID=UPI0019226343|nr:uncharacterized protein LOC120209913 isoform X2 [Hibiscus syriacus]